MTVNDYDLQLVLWAWPIGNYQGYSYRYYLYGLMSFLGVFLPCLTKKLQMKLSMMNQPIYHALHSIYTKGYSAVGNELSYLAKCYKLETLYHFDNYDHDAFSQETCSPLHSIHNLLSFPKSVYKIVFVYLSHKYIYMTTQHFLSESKYDVEQVQLRSIYRMFHQLNYGVI